MHKEVDVIEQPVKINMVVQPVDTDIQEPVVGVEVLVDDQDVEVEDVHIVDIEMTEAFPFMTNGALNEHMNDKDVLLDGGVAVDKNDEWVLLQDLLEISAGSGAVSHQDLHGREMSNQHPISAIENLQENLYALGATERVYASSNGLGEFRRWHDGNPSGEDRSGYFVSIAPGTDEIEICDATGDVYGISVHNSGFIGNQDDGYYKGKDLLKNNANDPSYAVVGIVGAMRVRTDGTARNGEHVVPNAYGEATLSDNDYGYKVLSQGSYPSYNYVTIAITPQSDALSRLQSSVAGGDLGEILIKIENIDKDIGDLEIKVDASTEDIEDILGEIGGLQQRVTTAEEIVQNAVENAEEAKDVATQAASKAAQAQQDAQDAASGAISSANQALSELSALAGQMEPIVSWQSEDGLSSGAGGFVNQANEDHTLLSSIVYGSGPDGSSLAAIMQKVDENGAIIQHLVSHIDRYVVGEKSLSDGLTREEAKTILIDEYIYVPTSDHDETMSGDPEIVTAFRRGYYYVWDVENGIWTESTELVSMSTIYNDGKEDGELWYCWQDVIVNDDAYVAGTLYRWFGSEWIAVATIADNRNARVLTSIRQEADSIQSDVVNLRGDVSSIEQNVNGITTRVGTAEGNISSINQEVDEIQSTVANINGTVSSLQQHTTDTDASLTAIAFGRFPTVYNSFTDTVPPTSYDEQKYTHPPVWDDTIKEFVFNDTYLSDDGTYYFFSDDKTKYCHTLDDTNYELWTISKEITAMITSRIDENQASIDTLAKFTEDTNEHVESIGKEVETHTESIANISELANKNEASITSLTSRYYHILLSVSAEEVPAYGNKYDESPEWDAASGKYKFTTIARDDGIYYMVDENSQTYCKVVTTDNGTVLYETYGLAGSSLAAIEQKVDANSSSIGLVVTRTDNVIDENGNLKDDAISSKGSIIIEAINGESTARISADKIKLSGTDEISLAVQSAKDDANKRMALVASSQMFIKEVDATTYTPTSITLTAQTTGDIASYAWYKNDELLSGETTNTLIVEPDDFDANSATYKVVGKDADGNEYTDMISIAKLSDGKDGQDGNNGQTYYTWVKYADSPTAGMSDNPDGKEYIGLAYNKTSQTESDDYEDYQWSLIKGADGIGVDGKTYYTWVKYADDGSGTNMSDSPDGKKYIGLAYNKEEPTESTNESDYTWALFKGSDGIAGEDGYTVILSNEFIEVPVNSERKPTDDIAYMCKVDVYKGLTALTPTTGEPSVSEFKIDIGIEPTEFTVSQPDAGTLEIAFDSQKAIQDSSYIPLEITVHGGMVLSAMLVVMANMNEVTVSQVANVAKIEQKVTENSSSISLVVQNGKASGELMMNAINDDTSSVKIKADRLNLEGYATFTSLETEGATIINGANIQTGTITADRLNFNVGDMIAASISGFESGMKLEVANGETSSTITLTSGETQIASETIQFTGDVIFKSNLTDGETTISGNNIQTGVLQSSNYSYTSGNTYANYGTQIDLTYGAITSKNFAIDLNGIIYANEASLENCVIKNMLIIASNTNGKAVSYMTTGSMVDLNYNTLPLLNVNDGQFTIASDGFVTVKNGLNLISTGSSLINRTALAFTTPNHYYANQYVQLSHIDAYYNTDNSRYETRWITDSSDVIKIHSKNGGLSIDAGLRGELHLGTTLDNGGFGQLVYINSQQTDSATTILGTNIAIGAYGTKTISLTSGDIYLTGNVYLNGTLLSAGGGSGGDSGGNSGGNETLTPGLSILSTTYNSITCRATNLDTSQYAAIQWFIAKQGDFGYNPTDQFILTTNYYDFIFTNLQSNSNYQVSYILFYNDGTSTSGVYSDWISIK